MNQKPVIQTSKLVAYILGVLNRLLPGITGIDIVPVLLPVRTWDKRFNQ